MDIVRTFQQFAEGEAFLFDYGTRATLNLLDSIKTGTWTGNADDIYFFLDKRTGEPILNDTKTSSQYVRYNGSFLILKPGDLDTTYMEKYESNIEPLLPYLNRLERFFACTEFVLESYKWDDAIQIFDVNCDGIYVQFRIKSPKNFTVNGGSTSS
jgi:hypothetical protein